MAYFSGLESDFPVWEWDEGEDKSAGENDGN